MRERLIELIQASVGGCARNWAEVIADHLLENGVIVPPCKVGDKVYVIDTRLRAWWKGKAISLYYTNRADIQFAVAFDDGEVLICDSHEVFLTKEEAEQALKGGVQE